MRRTESLGTRQVGTCSTTYNSHVCDTSSETIYKSVYSDLQSFCNTIKIPDVESDLWSKRHTQCMLRLDLRSDWPRFYIQFWNYNWCGVCCKNSKTHSSNHSGSCYLIRMMSQDSYEYQVRAHDCLKMLE